MKQFTGWKAEKMIGNVQAIAGTVCGDNGAYSIFAETGNGFMRSCKLLID